MVLARLMSASSLMFWEDEVAEPRSLSNMVQWLVQASQRQPYIPIPRALSNDF